jgi:hypothetical protein
VGRPPALAKVVTESAPFSMLASSASVRSCNDHNTRCPCAFWQTNTPLNDHGSTLTHFSAKRHHHHLVIMHLRGSPGRETWLVSSDTRYSCALGRQIHRPLTTAQLSLTFQLTVCILTSSVCISEDPQDGKLGKSHLILPGQLRKAGFNLF